jgi:hypothetical protein
MLLDHTRLCPLLVPCRKYTLPVLSLSRLDYSHRYKKLYTVSQLAYCSLADTVPVDGSGRVQAQKKETQQ